MEDGPNFCGLPRISDLYQKSDVGKLWKFIKSDPSRKNFWLKWKKQEIVGWKTEFRNQNKLIHVIFVKTSKTVAGSTQDGLMIIQYVCM